MKSRARDKEKIVRMVGRLSAAPPCLAWFVGLWFWISFQGSLLPQTIDVRLPMGIQEKRERERVLRLCVFLFSLFVGNFLASLGIFGETSGGG